MHMRNTIKAGILILVMAAAAVHAGPVRVSMIWDPDDFPQWNAAQYLRELSARFGDALSVEMYYAEESMEVYRQLLILEQGTQALMSYIQGRMLLQSTYWEDSAGYAGVPYGMLIEGIESGRARKLFRKQKTPEKLRAAYDSREYPLIMVEGAVYPDVPDLVEWGSFINGFLPENMRKKILRETPAVQAEKLVLTVIEDGSKKTGQLDTGVVSGLERMGIEAEVRREDSDTKGSRKLLKKLKVKKLPVYLLDESVRYLDSFDVYVRAGMITKRKKHYVLNMSGGGAFYRGRKQMPGLLRIFVMPMCPYSAMAEEVIYNGIKSGAINADISVEVHYIVFKTTDSRKPFVSPFGKPDWEEAARQSVIQKDFPERFQGYLELRNRDPHSTFWDDAVMGAGLDPGYVKREFEEGMKCLEEDAALVKELGINRSPTFLWENRDLVTGLDNLRKIEVFKDIEAKEGTCGGK